MAAHGTRAAAAAAARRLCRRSAPGVAALCEFPQADGPTGLSRRPQLRVRVHPNTGYRELRKELSRAREAQDRRVPGGRERAGAALAVADGRPIAFLAIDFDPLAKGYVANLSRPGGNVTGIFVRQLELAAKRVEIAREVFPEATSVGIAFDNVSREQRDAAAEAARKLGLEPRTIEVKGQRGYGDAFDTMSVTPGQPIILPAGP